AADRSRRAGEVARVDGDNACRVVGLVRDAVDVAGQRIRVPVAVDHEVQRVLRPAGSLHGKAYRAPQRVVSGAENLAVRVPTAYHAAANVGEKPTVAAFGGVPENPDAGHRCEPGADLAAELVDQPRPPTGEVSDRPDGRCLAAAVVADR